MNPLDLKGPEFLVLYLAAFPLVMAGAACLRWLLRQPADEPRTAAFELDPYEIAYLAGGAEGTVRAAIVRLVHADAVSPAGGGELQANLDGPPPDACEAEQAVHQAVLAYPRKTLRDIRPKLTRQLLPIKRRLQDLGLVMRDADGELARFLSLGLMLALPLFGLVKIGVGISRNRPVGFLVVLCLVSIVVGLVAFGRTVHRSRRGDKVLAQLKKANAALKLQASRRRDGYELAGDDLVLGVGLFGLGILAGSRLAGLRQSLVAQRSSGSWFSDGGWGHGCGLGCGGAGCGGGGCGGGGGGCGGCGG